MIVVEGRTHMLDVAVLSALAGIVTAVVVYIAW
jgi:hypothetical protein